MNRLAQQTSPYLRQHAANPVDWWPWCAAALEQAHTENKPVLLSIGYSACHWCHVMAHESFEDTETAAQMNRLFINIKVDREERPDLDQIYQTAHQMLAERGGGWPLTVFLTPDGMPFFSGTYFPPQARHGLPAFRDVLDWAADTYTNQRAAIDVQNRSLLNALQSTIPMRTTDADLDLSLPHKAGQALLAQFDTRHGGFGSSSQGPKFPRCPDLALLFRNAVLDHDEAGQHAWLHTLRRMAEGGIFDHLGGGFARYSVDARWDIPHFEKMLYDNGLLLAHYAEAFALTGDPLFARTARATANWAIREMQSEKGRGGFYAALDADSEGEEGKYYVWDRQEIARLLSPAQYAVFAAHYGLNRSANFEGRHWHLRIAEALNTVAEKCGISLTDAQLLLEESRACLLAERQKRIPPGCDDKILTGWNALMIAGLARAACVFGEPTWLASAQRAMDFVRERLWQGGRLRATCQAGQTARSPQSDPLNQPGQSGQSESAQLDAYLDDHACLLNATLALMQAEFHHEDLDFACTLADALLEHFEDRTAGGFFFTRDNHETLVLRPKPGHDNATPSGNGIAAQALQRLGHLLGETRYLTAAERTLRVFHDEIRRSENQGYWGSASLLLALAEYGTPPDIIILRGPAKETKEWQRQLQARCAPATLIFYLPDELKELPAAMDKPVSGSPTAWICRGTECLPPENDWGKVFESLEST